MNPSDLQRMSDDQARYSLEQIRWPQGPVCPHCASVNAIALKGKSCRPGLHKCRDCRGQFTVTIGTIFEDSHIPLGNWLYAFASMCASKKGISAFQLHRELEVTYKTAWFMRYRIRLAMKEGMEQPMLTGTVEVNETHVGGKPRKGGLPR